MHGLRVLAPQSLRPAYKLSSAALSVRKPLSRRTPRNKFDCRQEMRAGVLWMGAASRADGI